MASLFGVAAGEDGQRKRKTVTYGRLAQARPRPQDASTSTVTSSVTKSSASHLTGRLTSAQEHQRSSALPSIKSAMASTVLKNGAVGLHGIAAHRKEKKPLDDFDFPASNEDVQRPQAPSSRITPVRSRATPHAGTQPASQPQREPVIPSKRRKVGHEPSPSTNGTTAVTSLSGRKDTRITPSKLMRDNINVAQSPRSLSKDTSAPARLFTMTAEVSIPELDLVSEDSEVQTPKRKQPALSKSLSLTPKQSNLWSQLLDLDTATAPDSPSRGNRAVKGLISRAHPQLASQLSASAPMRLADRLKQDSQDMDLLDDLDSVSSISEGSDTGPEPAAKAPATISQSFGHSQSQSGPRTYAETRSYLQETNFEDALLQPLIELPTIPTTTSAVDDEELDSDNGATQGVRSVHELRAAGNRKRFLDEIELLTDEIKVHTRQSASRRRNALSELSERLRDHDFMKNFMGSEAPSFIFHQCKIQRPQDPIADLILCVLLCQLSRVELSRHQLEALSSPQVTNWVIKQVRDKRELAILAKDRACNMAKASQASWLSFMETSKLTVLDEMVVTNLTVDLVALATLDRLIHKLQESGMRQELLPETSMVVALNMFMLEWEFWDPDKVLRQHYALSILEAESGSIAKSPAAIQLKWKSRIKTLAKFTADILPDATASRTVLVPLLRLLLNVTNNQPESCAVFASVPYAVTRLLMTINDALESVSETHVEWKPGQFEETLDVLLLCLGLAINLAEHSAEVRRAALPQAPSEPYPDMLLQLARIFVRGAEKSSQAQSLTQSRTNVAYGYLAVLLGNLCLDEDVAREVKGQMPDGDMWRLIGAVEEFVGYHRRVDDGELAGEAGAAEGVQGAEAWGAFTERLGRVLERIKT